MPHLIRRKVTQTHTLQSTEDPTDPLLSDLRARGIVEPPYWCNGTAFEPEADDADVAFAPMVGLCKTAFSTFNIQVAVLQVHCRM